MAATEDKPLEPTSIVNRHGKVTDPEVWMDYWSEELLTLWHDVQERCGMLGAAVLDECDFPAFAQFCWEHSSRYPPAA